MASSWVPLRAVPKVMPAGLFQVMSGAAWAIAKVWSTEAAGFQLPSPAWLAVMVQEPAPVMVTTSTRTLQSPVALKLTPRFELAVALTVNEASPKVLGLRTPKLIV